ncbi:exodeoxyribonuclease V subunit gamma, partial [Salmonella enterica subsp. enterica serovar Cerro]|nr:exodeoxyribonuclease V subunit gamma [Salmonella enterica subsp. enterica serovar Cerro]
LRRGDIIAHAFHGKGSTILTDEGAVLAEVRQARERGVIFDAAGGIDDDNVRELELPATGQHTWQFGLTRMLLGYAMESAQGEWHS